jgi:hypothetical protein
MQAADYSLAAEFHRLRSLGLRHSAAIALAAEHAGVDASTAHELGVMFAPAPTADEFRALLSGAGVDVDALEDVWRDA